MSRNIWKVPSHDHVSIDGPPDPFDAIFDSLHARPNALNMICGKMMMITVKTKISRARAGLSLTRTSRRLTFTTSTVVVVVFFFFRRTTSCVSSSPSEPPMNSHSFETAAATAGGVWARDEMGKSTRGSACCIW